MKANYATQLLEKGAHLVEYLIAVITLLLATFMSGHLLVLCWGLVSRMGQESSALPIKGIVVEAMNILIVLELMAVFIRLESRRRVGIALLLDTAALFSIRETVLGLYAHSPTVWTSELSAAMFVGLHVLYSRYQNQKSKIPEEEPKLRRIA